MLINPNLISEKDLRNDFTNVEDRSWKLWRYYLPKGLIEGETYTISCKLKQGKNGSGFATIKSVNMKEPQNEDPFYEWKVPIDNFQGSFIYNSNKMDCVEIYIDISGQTAFKTAERSEVKLEKGKEKTPYIPNERDVDPLKLLYFIGGYVQRGLSNLVSTLSNLLLGRRLQHEN